MIEQFLTPQEWAEVWCQNVKDRNPVEYKETGERIMKRITPYCDALCERLDEAGLTLERFANIMTTLAMLEEAFEAKYKGATQ